MYFDSIRDQWFIIDGEPKTFGQSMRANMIVEHIVSSGTVMVFCVAGNPYAIFQTLEGMDLSKLTDQSLVGYAPGSLWYCTGRRFLRTIRFRDCRMPTKSEYNKYQTMSII